MSTASSSRRHQLPPSSTCCPSTNQIPFKPDHTRVRLSHIWNRYHASHSRREIFQTPLRRCSATCSYFSSSDAPAFTASSLIHIASQICPSGSSNILPYICGASGKVLTILLPPPLSAFPTSSSTASRDSAVKQRRTSVSALAFETPRPVGRKVLKRSRSSSMTLMLPAPWTRGGSAIIAVVESLKCMFWVKPRAL